MSERPDFQNKQYEFAAHIRDPENSLAPPGIEDRRMGIYRDLFFNNLRNLLGTFFPVMRKIHSDEHWRHLVREFMKIHRAKTPYFLELPEEFLAFLQNEYTPTEDDYPFLTELAHYEYADLALRVSTDENDVHDIDPHGDLLQHVPVKSVLAWAFAYRYPVHRVAADFLPTETTEQPSYLAVYRRSDDKVRFLELNAVTAALLDAVENNDAGLNGEALLRQLAATIHYPDVEALIKHGVDALEEMRQLEILTGTRRAG
ncbi:MAG: putative DNA-binding domain-containing protein [Gammaproteobacteria bacterium]|nr:putative DNA-binding domain-containing protein [Gammaproteobacteria bacterium]MDH5240155.1 putative DNA-binding domain-containing protein [Gammaproteobacteria bacterium]MDH5260597.1 putative DNA-binding domain-containing protein [Gammaproteobacteria bacterium]MDH5583067.1 putative DNA-binding domain-containing protein [Gammaproteobacteria bacterium]